MDTLLKYPIFKWALLPWKLSNFLGKKGQWFRGACRIAKSIVNMCIYPTFSETKTNVGRHFLPPFSPATPFEQTMWTFAWEMNIKSWEYMGLHFTVVVLQKELHMGDKKLKSKESTEGNNTRRHQTWCEICSNWHS